jgi:hypothetical protein
VLGAGVEVDTGAFVAAGTGFVGRDTGTGDVGVGGCTEYVIDAGLDDTTLGRVDVGLAGARVDACEATIGRTMIGVDCCVCFGVATD